MATPSTPGKSPSGSATASQVMAPPSTPDRSPSGSEMFGAVIDIIVGTNNAIRTFKVHEAVLRFYSGHFKAILSTEAQQGAIKMPTEDSSIFETFSLWLYTRRFNNPVGEDDVTQLTVGKLMKLWVFGEKYQIPLLQNEVLNFIHKKFLTEKETPLNILQWLYEHTAPTSSLRKYYIEIVARKGRAENQLSAGKLGLWPRAALIDVMRVTWAETGGRCTTAEIGAWDLCRYHVHEEGVNCKKADESKK